MTLGQNWYQRQPRAFLGDTNLITAYLYDTDTQDLVPQGSITSALFTILKPGDSAATPSINAQAGTVVGDGKATYLAPTTLHDTAGHYKGRVAFAYTDAASNPLTRSVTIEYEIADPFETAGANPYDPAVDLAWSYFEDVFDSDDGGPWLKDMTMAFFDREKIRSFVPEVLSQINVQFPQGAPFTTSTFPFNNDGALAIFALGLRVSTIRHLIRSYTEQPNPANSPVPYHDRQGYLQRWQSVLESENKLWEEQRALWKASQWDYTASSISVFSKAGRMQPGFIRARGSWGPYGSF